MKKSGLIVFVILAYCLLAMAPSAQANREPPGDLEHLQGPAMVGTIIIKLGEAPNQDGALVPALLETITIKVKGMNKVGNIAETSDNPADVINWFNAATEASLQDMRLNSELALQLQIDDTQRIPIGALIINSVTSFTKTDTNIIADVVILYVVPK